MYNYFDTIKREYILPEEDIEMIKCRLIPCKTFQGYQIHKHERVQFIKVNKSSYQNSLPMTLSGSKINVVLEMAIPSLVL